MTTKNILIDDSPVRESTTEIEGNALCQSFTPMKLGMPTLIEFDHIRPNIDLCCELKLDFIELNMNLPICNPENLSAKTIENIKAHLKESVEELNLRHLT